MSEPKPLHEAAAPYRTSVEAGARPEPWSHPWHDLIGLLYHRAMADKIRQQPFLLNVARENLRRWMASEPKAPPSPARKEWQEILSSDDIQQIVALMTDPSEEGHRRRQSSPFAGILDAEERRVIREQII